MARPQRIHVLNGTYYVVQQRLQLQRIFFDSEDFGAFEVMLSSAMRRAGAKAYAYCWMEEGIHLVMRTGHATLGSFMQDVNSRLAKQIQRRAGEVGPFFDRRYRSVLVDPDTYLLELIRYVHYVPVYSGRAVDPFAYDRSSCNAYLRGECAPWLDTSIGLGLLSNREDAGHAFMQFMAQPSPASVRTLFGPSRQLSRILGGREFLATLPRSLRQHTTSLSLDDVVAQVSVLLGISRERILSRSQQRDVVLARALVGWYSMERRIATLQAVARYFRRAPSTLSVGIYRYRCARPDLFVLDVFRHQTPIVTVRELGIDSRST